MKIHISYYYTLHLVILSADHHNGRQCQFGASDVIFTMSVPQGPAMIWSAAHSLRHYRGYPRIFYPDVRLLWPPGHTRPYFRCCVNALPEAADHCRGFPKSTRLILPLHATPLEHWAYCGGSLWHVHGRRGSFQEVLGGPRPPWPEERGNGQEGTLELPLEGSGWWVRAFFFLHE